MCPSVTSCPFLVRPQDYGTTGARLVQRKKECRALILLSGKRDNASEAS